jgi:outer membrane protein
MRSRPLYLALALASLCAQPVMAAQGDWLFRAGLGIVDPKSDNLALDTDTNVQVKPGSSATVEAVYMLADHWGVELLAAYPFRHDVKIDGLGKVGNVRHLPPTLSLQYHFLPEARIRPYVGAGINYTTFSREKTAGALAGSDLDLDDSWGAAVQVGTDIGLNDNWFLNLGLRWIDIDTKAKLDGDRLGTIEIDPLVYQVQLGYRFGRPAAAPQPVAAAAAPPPPAAAPVAAAPPPPVDSDGDGVPDTADLCPATPRGDRVDSRGCSCDVTRQVQFAVDSAELTAAGRATLDEMAEELQQLNFIAGTVVGHTDSSGSEAYNQALSERRAQTVASYLQAQGVARGRLQARGAGESQPIADNETPEGRALNRRVVLTRTDCD